MKIYLVQMHSDVTNKEANLNKILDYIDAGLDSGANLITFGECALTGYDMNLTAKFAELAEPVPGPAVEKVAKKIAGKNCYVVFGMTEADGSYVYNSAPLIGPKGLVGVCRKLYLCSFKSVLTGATYAEHVFFKPGQRISVFDTEFGKIGVQICLDLYYPEVALAQVLAGAWLIVHPSATPLINVRKGELPTIWATRPWENSVCWAYVNLVGEQAGYRFNGGTAIYLGTHGLQKQASIGEQAKEEVIEYEVDREVIYEARRTAMFIPKFTRPDVLEQLLAIAKKAQSGGSL